MQDIYRSSVDFKEEFKMEINEPTANSNWRDEQKEQARERRRIWDRQRRLSMSLEEKQIHLAKRRRNYQLRRQKAESAALLSNGMEFETDHAKNDNLSLVPIPELSNQFANIDHFQNQKISFSKFEGTDAKSYKSPNNSKRLRLWEIKRLARKGKPVAFCQQAGTDVMEKESLTMNCIKKKGVRLIHIKRLARALNSPVTTASDLAHLSTEPEQQGDAETGVKNTLANKLTDYQL